MAGIGIRPRGSDTPQLATMTLALEQRLGCSHPQNGALFDQDFGAVAHSSRADRARQRSGRGRVMVWSAQCKLVRCDRALEEEALAMRAGRVHASMLQIARRAMTSHIGCCSSPSGPVGRCGRRAAALVKRYSGRYLWCSHEAAMRPPAPVLLAYSVAEAEAGVDRSRPAHPRETLK